MSQTYSFERDLKEAEVMVGSLESYIRQDNLYGTAGGGMFSSGSMPSLTVGALLMRLRRLNDLRSELSESQQARLDDVIENNAHVANEWRLHYTGKMDREVKSRLDAMKTFFDECRSNPSNCANLYRPEALRRTIVQDLLFGMKDMNVDVDDELKRKLQQTDNALRAWLIPAGFQWASELEPAYPRSTFWWLYQNPRA